MQKILLLLVSFLTSISLNCQGQTLKTYKTENDPLNMISFQSDGLIEDIIGIGSKISASIKLSPEDVDVEEGGFIRFDLSDLKTGNEERDKEMKGPNYLDVKNYGIAQFKLLTISAHNVRKLENAKKVVTHVTGDFTLHGVTKTLMIPVTFVYFNKSEQTKKRAKGNLLDIFCIFKIKLSDYGIKVPELFSYRVNEEIEIKVNIVLSEEDK
ncbi:MAG: YceI family protein [Cytophagales bacterium]|nr:YceI family protein [Cytophagales bacterium]